MSFNKPWHNGARAYHTADSIPEVIRGFKRCRTIKHFILTDKGVLARKNLKCSECKERITVERGNRGEYNPRTRTVIVMHYDCSWGAIFNALPRVLA